MKSLKVYREIILLHKSDPHFLAGIGLELGADEAYYNEQYGEYNIDRAKFIKGLIDEGSSVAAAEVQFLTTEDGVNWERLKRKIKGIEALQKALTNINIANTLAAKNQI